MPKMNFENVFIGANPLGKTCLLNFPETEACPGTQRFPKLSSGCRVVLVKDLWAEGVRGRK